MSKFRIVYLDTAKPYTSVILERTLKEYYKISSSGVRITEVYGFVVGGPGPKVLEHLHRLCVGVRTRFTNYLP